MNEKFQILKSEFEFEHNSISNLDLKFERKIWSFIFIQFLILNRDFQLLISSLFELQIWFLNLIYQISFRLDFFFVYMAPNGHAYLT